MDQEEAPPPPYSAVDPLHAQAANRNGNSSLRSNGASSQAASSSRSAESNPLSGVAPHFTSAAAYFEERPPAFIDDSRGLLCHHMTIYPRSQAKDFPRRPRCWASRRNEVSQQDWDTFLRYLFPAQLGLAASSQHLPRQLRAEIQRDRKDRPQETDDQRRARIAAVVDEWNQCFFELRAARIVFAYVGEPDAAPTSALCPRCYPAATQATRSLGASDPVESQAGAVPSTHSPVAGQHAPSPHFWPAPAFPPFAGAPPPMPYGTPYGAPPFPAHAVHGIPQNGQPPQYYTPPPPPLGVAPWQWNPWYNQPQFEPSEPSKEGAFGWISELASKAQKYGERFAEQAQHYSDQLSAQALHYGQQVEGKAMAHGWTQDAYAPGYYPAAPGQLAWSPSQASQTGAATYSPATPLSPVNNTRHPHIAQTRVQDTSNGNPRELTRRSSVSSNDSENTLSSIDTLSTTSDLSASDLASVRTQLEALDDHHDRTLYDAAVDLRRQLTLLQESRREARTRGKDWRADRLQQSSRKSEADWGRWESPEQQQRQSTERRVMKEERRATRKAFRDAVRRAREEQRERRRARKVQRQLAHARSEEDGGGIALHGGMERLALDESSRRLPARSQTMPLTQAAPARRPVRSETSSELSVPGAIHTPSSASQASVHDSPVETPDRKAKFKAMLKIRQDKKQKSSGVEKSDGESSKGPSKKDPNNP